MAYRIGENCIGCTACTLLCPVYAISGERGKLHVINDKRCVECGVCGRVCRNDAIRCASGEACSPVPRAQWNKPEIDTGKCTACGLCVSVCRFKALRIAQPAQKGDIHVTAELSDPAKCVGCELCRHECPLKIITMKGRGES